MALLQSYGMPKVIEVGEFFVVGGPVQPDRPCYVERAVDRQLKGAIYGRRLTCVLGAPGVGKSSLMYRAARTLRREGVCVAVVSMRQLAERGAREEAQGWLRSIAASVVRELKLDVVVADWWAERDERVGETPFVDFLGQQVLPATTVPVVVFLDDVDAVLELPTAHEFLEALAACYLRREREPAFARLNFVLLGCASRRALAGDDPGSPFADAMFIEPADFSANESYRLAIAFGGEPEQAQALMDRICAWTGGHPYLTQKIARGVAHKGGRFEDVERVVREQVLARDSDPLLAKIRAGLLARTRSARRAVKLLQKVATGSKAVAPSDPSVWERLQLSGAAVLGENRRLELRNRIVKELIAARWLRVPGTGWRRAAIAAGVLAVAVGLGGYWYTQYLPIADVATLTSATADAAAVDDAYRRLRQLPGFAERAERLWVAALRQQSSAAEALSEVATVDAKLRSVAGQDAAADQLFAEFWLRRAAKAANDEQRDIAILMARRAAALPAAPPQAAALLTELVAADYSHLERSLRLATPPPYWHMAFEQSLLVSFDGESQLLRTPFGSAAGIGTLGAAPLGLTGLKLAALQRELAVAGEGTAGEFELSVALQHPQASELLVTLTAPSGAQAVVTVPSSDGAVVETFLFAAAEGSELEDLVDEGRNGVWRLTVVDRQEGGSGALVGWGLRFGESVVRDDPTDALPIPEPVRTADVAVATAGGLAVVWPKVQDAIGTVAVWNLTTGRLEHDLVLPVAPLHVAIDPTGTRVLAATDRVLTLWNVADGVLVARVATQTAFVLPPVFSTDGAYLAIAERVDAAPPLYSVLLSADAKLVGSVEGSIDAESWQLGPGARYFALLGPATTVNVVDARRGTALRRLAHGSAVARILPLADGTTVVTVDGDGDVAAWPLDATGTPRSLGQTVSAASVDLAADGTRVAYAREEGAVVVIDTATGTELYRLRQPRAESPPRTQLAADGSRLVTQSGELLRLWSLPSAPPRAERTDGAAATALAVDRTLPAVAVGLRSGQLQVATAGDLASFGETLELFGHRGPITTVALNANRGLAATGGADGIVRVWDLESKAPVGIVMQPATAPIGRVVLSPDGRLVANAAGNVVRVANVADGRVIAELSLAQVVTALAFAPDGSAIASGDRGGLLLLAVLGPERLRTELQIGTPITAIAFSPAGDRVAIGGADGRVGLVRVADGVMTSDVRSLSQPVRALDVSSDGGVLVVLTDDWLHALAVTPGLPPIASRLAPVASTGAALAALPGTAVRVAGLRADGGLELVDRDLGEPSSTPADPKLVGRDWPSALGVRLNDNGEPVPFDP